MSYRHWLIYLVTPTAEADKKLRVPRALTVLCAAVAILGIIGLARCMWFAGSYAYARVGVYTLRRENANLQKTVRFLEKFTGQKSRQMQALASFEDQVRLKFGMNTVSEDVRQAGVGGRPDMEALLLASIEDPPVHQASGVKARIEAMLRQLDLQDSTFSRMTQHVSRQHDLWSQRPSIWPCCGRITSGYGYRYHPLFRRNMFHEGIDIGNKVWTPVFATASGIINEVGRSNDYGIYVFVEHGGTGFTTVFAHLRQAAVVEGQVVRRGELVGYLGNTGRSTGPHLHYEIRKFNKHINPMDYILPLNVVID